MKCDIILTEISQRYISAWTGHIHLSIILAKNEWTFKVQQCLLSYLSAICHTWLSVKKEMKFFTDSRIMNGHFQSTSDFDFPCSTLAASFWLRKGDTFSGNPVANSMKYSLVGSIRHNYWVLNITTTYILSLKFSMACCHLDHKRCYELDFLWIVTLHFLLLIF